MNWKKLIPAYLEIRSLYWVEHGKKMDSMLKEISLYIDNDNYKAAEEGIEKFEKTFSQNSVPHWIALKYSKIYSLQSMLTFFTDK